MTKLVELDALPRGQKLINADAITHVDLVNGHCRITFIGGASVEVPHDFQALGESLRLAGVEVITAS